MIKVVKNIEMLNAEQRRQLCGVQDEFLNIIKNVFGCEIVVDKEQLIILIDEKYQELIGKVFDQMSQVLLDGKELKSMDVQIMAESIYNGVPHEVNHLYKKAVGRSFEHKLIYPKTVGQMRLLEALSTKDMIFVSGPAGTGKTFLSVVYAVTQLRNEEVKRLIVTRPVVEAGENLGFLPGDLKEKVDPYLRPIYDALYFTLGQVTTERLLEKGIIEIAPLAYMRGRTLDDAIIILDEAQNTTPMQMKMFLTRMGFDSKMIITGDMTQVDLPSSKGSGFIDALRRLEGIDEIGFVNLQNSDVVRHPLVKKILTKYEDK